MMSDGYVPWLALSPQGKYPVRFGDRADPGTDRRGGRIRDRDDCSAARAAQQAQAAVEQPDGSLR